MLSPLAPWPWAKRQELTVSVRFHTLHLQRMLCTQKYSALIHSTFFLPSWEARRNHTGKTPKCCLEEQMQESAAKAAASLHQVWKRVPAAGRQHVKFPEEGIKRLLMDNSNPAENLLPLGDPASAWWSTQGDGCCWVCRRMMWGVPPNSRRALIRVHLSSPTLILSPEGLQTPAHCV